jgi:hypothetical protein
MDEGRGAEGAEAGADARAADEEAGPAPAPAWLPPGLDLTVLRRDYEGCKESVASIRARTGLSAYQLRTLRETGGWNPRSAAAKRDPIAPGTLGGSAQRRLDRIVTAGIATLDQEIADSGWNGDSARRLLELCRAREMIMRSDRSGKAAEPREKKNKNDDRRDPIDDPAWVRAELERRILQFRRARGLEGGARKGDG